MRVVLAGGGTAGHISPGIAVAERLRQRRPDVAVSFVCSQKPLDARVLTAAGIDHYPLPAAPFPYRPSPGLAVAGVKLLRSALRARRLLRELDCAAVLGVGGYVSVPVVLAAHWLRLPVAVHVLDVQPDRATRLTSRWATRIAVAFAEAAPSFPAAGVEVTGCPVRRAILEASRPEALAALGLEPGRLTILVQGGSQGARHINRAVVEALPELLNRPLQILHLTGERDYAEVARDTAALAALHGHYQAFAFSDNMGQLLAAADVVVGRAGSSSLAEASARGCPQVLIPYPHAGGHQMANARALQAAGGAVVLPDDECTPAALLRILADLAEHPTRTNEMSRAARRWASPHAAERLAEMLLALAESAPPA